MKNKIKDAWGKYFHQVESRLDREGWYDGSNDSIQKEFPNIEVTKARFHQRPTILGEVQKPQVISGKNAAVIAETVVTKVVTKKQEPVKK